jgi:hypothetical protein
MAKDIVFDNEFGNELSPVDGTNSIAVTDPGARRGRIFQRFIKAVRDSRQRAVEREVERIRSASLIARAGELAGAARDVYGVSFVGHVVEGAGSSDVRKLALDAEPAPAQDPVDST